MKESNVRKMLIDKLSDIASIDSIENTAGTGMPDNNISYLGRDYWVELKYRPEPPKRDKTPILKGFLRASQIVWITNRIEKGSRNIFLFARIEDEFFLYHIKNVEALKDIETLSIDEFYDRCIWYGSVRKVKDWEDFLKAMRTAECQ
jgi:hypothetical protein